MSGLDQLGDTNLSNKRNSNILFKKDFDVNRFNDKLTALLSANGSSEPHSKTTGISK